MSVRIATFNAENLMRRFDFSGFHNDLNMDRSLLLYDIRDERQYRELEQARAIAHTDDYRQLTALAIAATNADILCLQEVDNLEVLKAFEYGYLFKMIGSGYRNKYLIEGNDTRGINVAVMMREQTRDGEPIECLKVTSHAGITFDELNLYDEGIAALGIASNEKVFRRDCLELDLRIGNRPLTLYVTHLKSMGSPRNGVDGRTSTLPLRRAEARIIRSLITRRFGETHTHNKNWLICGDLNDYQQHIQIDDNGHGGHTFTVLDDPDNAINVFTQDGFAENLVARLDPMQRWTLYHTSGPEERHLCQLDYILASPAMASRNATAKPDIIRKGQPWRTIFPPAQEVERFPRTGWDRPKASDHCPVAMTFNI